MMQDTDIDLHQIWCVLWRHRYVILATAAVSGLAALAVNLSLPQLYQSQSLVALPESGRYVVNDRYDKVRTTVLTVAETRVLLEPFPAGALPPADRSLQRFRGISLDQVRGSDVFFRMVVTVRDDPGAAVVLSSAAVEFLQSRPVVRGKIDQARSAAERHLRDIDDAIARVARAGARPGGDPVAAELGTVQLKGTRYQVSGALDQLHSFQFVSGPELNPVPVGPKTVLRTVVFLFVGLFIGSCGAFIHHAMGRQQPPQ
jgi:LPS O-antigen subunit length determinant protein (WzzB/FepE family)